MEIKRSEKGVLLTLVTIVLLVLMVAELISYVYLTISYDNISSFGYVSGGASNFASSINGSSKAFLHASLYSALAVYGSNTQNSNAINNTALQSLMGNGMLYGNNETIRMGGATLVNYTNSVKDLALREGFNLSITNSSIKVYETNASWISATYRALATINSSSGSFTYPIIADAAVLNES